MEGDTHIEFELPRLARPLSKAEADYMQGGAQPATSSILTSNSKFLNSPLFREAWMQMSLRRFAPDLPDTYCIPMMIRGIADVSDIGEFLQKSQPKRRGTRNSGRGSTRGV